MIAIVNIAGQQFRVEKDQVVFVNRLDAEEGSKVDFNDVLLLDNKGKFNVGTPFVEGAQVKAKVLEHLKADKIRVFKKKRRKGYQVENGHRQPLTRIQIEGISAKAPRAKKAEEAPAEGPAETTEA
jgi:large subunit ribosomal protein L21